MSKKEKEYQNRIAALQKVKRVVESCVTYQQTFYARRYINLYRRQFKISSYFDPKDTIIDLELERLRGLTFDISEKNIREK